jgi:hypothetical protein
MQDWLLKVQGQLLKELKDKPAEADLQCELNSFSIVVDLDPTQLRSSSFA